MHHVQTEVITLTWHRVQERHCGIRDKEAEGMAEIVQPPCNRLYTGRECCHNLNKMGLNREGGEN